MQAGAVQQWRRTDSYLHKPRGQMGLRYLIDAVLEGFENAIVPEAHAVLSKLASATCAIRGLAMALYCQLMAYLMS